MQAFLKVSFKPGEGVPMEGSPNLLGRNLVKYGDCWASRCRLFMAAVDNDGVVAIIMVSSGVTQKQNMNIVPRHLVQYPGSGSTLKFTLVSSQVQSPTQIEDALLTHASRSANPSQEPTNYQAEQHSIAQRLAHFTPGNFLHILHIHHIPWLVASSSLWPSWHPHLKSCRVRFHHFCNATPTSAVHNLALLEWYPYFEAWSLGFGWCWPLGTLLPVGVWRPNKSWLDSFQSRWVLPQFPPRTTTDVRMGWCPPLSLSSTVELYVYVYIEGTLNIYRTYHYADKGKCNVRLTASERARRVLQGPYEATFQHGQNRKQEARNNQLPCVNNEDVIRC